MAERAECVYNDCEVCAQRQIGKTEFTDHACHGGFDMQTFEYIFPCETCMNRLAPATQDYQDHELMDFLNQIEFPDVFMTPESEDDLHQLLYGEHQQQQVVMQEQQVETVFRELIQEQRAQGWPHISCTLTEQRVVEKFGIPRTFRFYKLFQRIMPQEEDEFKEFLSMIF